jgi:hypothetical protein
VRRLLALTAAVLLVHGLLLGGMPSLASLFSSGATPHKPVVASFVTRSIAADPVPAAPSTPARARAKPGTAPLAHTSPPVPAPAANPVDSADGAAGAPDTVGAPGSALPTLPALAPGDPGATGPGAQAAAQLAQTAAVPAEVPPAPPAPAQAPPNAPVAYPDPVRLLFDGRGEEKGYIKYAASAEMLWLHDGAQYSARLEISAWGFRVRTWTSKGALDEGGLQPLRFGDKPRGAELATHFQRDKGIISFSANNPDVPLQAGAQDKLSAILQLSALVGGAPERYNAGNSIRFQAADAHNAELWDFQVGALEALELPGGPKQALKLSKAPTREFDQRIEVWLAPDMHYLPVRLRITEANGAFADLLWRKTQSSE